MNAMAKTMARPTPIDPSAPMVAYSPAWFVRRQIANAERYLAGLAPFREDEFGPSAHAPSPAHIRAANRLVGEVRARLQHDIGQIRQIGEGLAQRAAPGQFDTLLRLKDKIYAQTKEAERLMAFYRGIFDQRHGRYGPYLHPLDRIGRDCYQAVWNGLGKARSIPAPAPFAYIEDGSGPATYRRGVRLTTLGKRPNPFPLIKVPQHRVQNPWTLGAVPHEVAHNLQNDLGMWEVLPKRIRAAMKGKVPDEAIDTWSRWHKEAYADQAGCLLIGPAYVESLIDVVAKQPRSTARFNPDGVHPTPLVRVPINCRLLRRIGFSKQADRFEATWNRIYPPALRRSLPAPFAESFDAACDILVQVCCFQPETAYGGKALAEVVRFSPKDAKLVGEAAQRLVKGETTGVLPERLLISAARDAFRAHQNKAASISRHFYQALGRG